MWPFQPRGPWPGRALPELGTRVDNCPRASRNDEGAGPSFSLVATDHARTVLAASVTAGHVLGLALVAILSLAPPAGADVPGMTTAVVCESPGHNFVSVNAAN